MEVGAARFSLYLVQLSVIIADAIGWYLERVPEGWAIPTLVLTGAGLFLTIYSDNQNDASIASLKSDVAKLAEQVSFLMRPHKKRRQPPG